MNLLHHNDGLRWHLSILEVLVHLRGMNHVRVKSVVVSLCSEQVLFGEGERGLKLVTDVTKLLISERFLTMLLKAMLNAFIKKILKS